MRIGLGTALAVCSGAPPNWLALWDADFGLSLTGSNVNSWTAKVGAYVLTPGGASKPTLNTTGINGRNAISFASASTQWLTNTTDTALYGLADGDDPNIAVFVQCVFVTAPLSVMVFFGAGGGAAANRFDFDCAGSATTIQLAEQGATGGGGSKVWTVADITAAPHIYGLVQTGTAQKLYVDNVDNGSDGAINVTARTATRFNVGAFSAGTAPLNGLIRRIGIMRAPTAMERAQIHGTWSAT